MGEFEQQASYTVNHRVEMRHLIPADATRVLDVGCGMGGWGATLREVLPHATIVGIDPVESSVAASRQSGHYSQVHQGYFPDALPESEEPFDTIFFNDVLEHVYDPAVMLGATHDLLAPGGKVVAAIPSIQYAPVLAELLGGRWDYADAGTLDRTHSRFFTRATMVELFEQNGFEVESCEPVNPVADTWVAHRGLAERLGRRALLRIAPDSKYVHFVITARRRTDAVEETESTADAKFAVVIPTLQRSSLLPELVRRLHCSPHVAEIIVINNAQRPLTLSGSKITLLNLPENIFVNPAWNLGVERSTAPLIALCNDDVLFEVDQLFAAVANRLDRGHGLIGAGRRCFDPSERGPIRFDRVLTRPEFYGTLMFVRRDDYVRIPDTLRIWFGDDYLFDAQRVWNRTFRGVHLDTPGSVTTSSSEFNPTIDADIKLYPGIRLTTYADEHAILLRLQDACTWVRRKSRGARHRANRLRTRMTAR